MQFPKTNQALIPRPIVWIVDRRRSDYDHLLADAKVRQLQMYFLDSGRELLQDWFAGAPDVCIVSLQSEDLGGLDVVEMIRPFPVGRLVCTITDKYRSEDEIRALSLGVHACLSKPLEKTVFFALCLCPQDETRHDPTSIPIACRRLLSQRDEDGLVDWDLQLKEGRMSNEVDPLARPCDRIAVPYEELS